VRAVARTTDEAPLNWARQSEGLAPEEAVDIRVLVIEDNDDLRESLCRYLGALGMTVHGLPDGAGLDAHLAQHAVDLVICDVNLPGENGFSLVARLRLTSKAGVIMLTARGLEADRLLGLSLGVDCYMVKPVNMRELEFTIRNLYRRLSDAPLVKTEAEEQGRWHYHRTLWTLTAPNGNAIKLTMAEARIVDCLLSQAGTPVPREALLEALGRPAIEAYVRNIDVSISRLRRKIEAHCDARLPVSSARGMGYAFSGKADIDA
jgi:DNA-binding response OmpR family regulator